MRRVAALAGARRSALVAARASWASAPAGAQDDDAPPRRSARSTPPTPTTVDVTFFYSGERADLGGHHRPRERRARSRPPPAVPLDDQQALGIVLVVDTSTVDGRTDALDRAGQGGGPRSSSTRRPPPTRSPSSTLRRRRSRVVAGLHHRQGRARRGHRRHRPRARRRRLCDGIVRSPALVPATPTLQPNLVVFTDGAGHRLDGRRQATAEAAVTRGRRHAVRRRRRERRLRRRSPAIAEATGGTATRRRRSRRRRRRCSTSVQATLRNQYVADLRLGGRRRHRADRRSPSASDTATAEFVAGSSQDGRSRACGPQPVGRARRARPSSARSAGLMLALGRGRRRAC